MRCVLRILLAVCGLIYTSTSSIGLEFVVRDVSSYANSLELIASVQVAREECPQFAKTAKSFVDRLISDVAIRENLLPMVVSMQATGSTVRKRLSVATANSVSRNKWCGDLAKFVGLVSENSAGTKHSAANSQPQKKPASESLERLIFTVPGYSVYCGMELPFDYPERIAGSENVLVDADLMRFMGAEMFGEDVSNWAYQDARRTLGAVGSYVLCPQLAEVLGTHWSVEKYIAAYDDPEVPPVFTFRADDGSSWTCPLVTVLSEEACD